MTIVRRERHERWTTVDKAVVNDSRLSFRARGVLVWLLDKPDDWRIRSTSIAEHGTEGRDAIRAAMVELETLGYLVRSRLNGADGKWHTEILIREELSTPPVEGWKSAPKPENQASVNQASVFQALKEVPIPSTEKDVRAFDEYPSSFERFWRNYPRRTGKRAAFKEWERAKKRATEAAILDGARLYAEVVVATKIETKYVKHPERWLRSDGWLDEYDDPDDESAVHVY